MKDKNKTKENIFLTEKILSDQNYLLTPDFRELKIYKENAARLEKLLPYLDIDIKVSKAIKSVMSRAFFSPFTLVVQLLKKMIETISKEATSGEVGAYINNTSNGIVASIKAKALTSIMDLLKEDANPFNFAEELNKVAFTKVKTTKELSDRTNIGYVYLNKLLNNKLKPNATISRDLTVKLCLGLELDLLEANNLMSRAGYILCGNTERDKLLSICVQNKAGVILTNEILEERNLPLLK